MDDNSVTNGVKGFVPDREFVIVTGNQGYGKSVWAKKRCVSMDRLFVYCPKESYDKVDFKTEPYEWVPRLLEREKGNEGKQKFRIGTAWPDECEAIGHSARAIGKCNVILDECALLFGRGELPDWAKPLVYMGREPQINLFVIAQRAANIPIAIRSQAARIISFRQTEPDDVKVLRERIGDAADELPALEKLTCLDWDGSGEVKRYTLTP